MLYYLMAERRLVQFGSVVALKRFPEDLQVVLGIEHFPQQVRLARLFNTPNAGYALVEYLKPTFSAQDIKVVDYEPMDEVAIVEAYRIAVWYFGHAMGAGEIDALINSFPHDKATSIEIYE